MTSPQLIQDFQHCQRIHRHYGHSYYFATRFFPVHKRQATYALYAFFRIFDEIVDTQYPTRPDLQSAALHSLGAQWHDAYHHGHSTHPVLRATSHIFHSFSIPYHYSQSFIQAMIQDTTQTRYATYTDLEAYMYGSAAVVGLMMTHVIGFSIPQTLDYAKQLGYAMQLTNFIRDIGEDYEQRGRIYMPLDELAQHGLSERDIQHRTISPSFVSFMQYQITRARALYTQSSIGIPDLHTDGRFAVQMASVLYSHILCQVEQQGYDVYSRRARVSTAQKILLLILQKLKKS